MPRKEKLDNPLYSNDEIKSSLDKKEDIYTMSKEEIETRKKAKKAEAASLEQQKDTIIPKIEELFDNLDHVADKNKPWASKSYFWFVLQLDNITSIKALNDFLILFQLEKLIK